MASLLFLLLPIAALLGWYIAFRNYTCSARDYLGNSRKSVSSVPRDYLIGLNFLLEEEPDKAVDVFIKMLEVDSDTVETHLALGGLFRRRGEVDRAIRIHQNLIARPHLDKIQRMQALLALGQDYMRAGVFDRAERIFTEIVEGGSEHTTAALRYLLDIYEQEKAWQQAINVVRKLERAMGEPMRANIAHYYCELALEQKNNHASDEARRLLRQAVAVDPQCVRASMIYGDLEAQEKHYKLAIRFYKQVKNQDSDYLSEVVSPLLTCYDALGSHKELLEYLRTCLAEHPRITVVLVLADRLQQLEGTDAAIEFITEYLRHQPSIRGLKRLIELQLCKEQGGLVKNLHLLSDLTEKMLRNKPIYRCAKCGFKGRALHWLCPCCKTWNSVRPIHGLEGD